MFSITSPLEKLGSPLPYYFSAVHPEDEMSCPACSHDAVHTFGKSWRRLRKNAVIRINKKFFDEELTKYLHRYASSTFNFSDIIGKSPYISGEHVFENMKDIIIASTKRNQFKNFEAPAISQAIESIILMSNLTDIKITGAINNDLVDLLIEQLTHLKHLQSLDLSSCGLKVEQLSKVLTSIASNKNISSVNLIGNKLSISQAKNLISQIYSEKISCEVKLVSEDFYNEKRTCPEVKSIYEELSLACKSNLLKKLITESATKSISIYFDKKYIPTHLFLDKIFPYLNNLEALQNILSSIEESKLKAPEKKVTSKPLLFTEKKPSPMPDKSTFPLKKS